MTYISFIINISMFWQRVAEGRLEKFWEEQFAWGRINWFSNASGKNYWICVRISTLQETDLITEKNFCKNFKTTFLNNFIQQFLEVLSQLCNALTILKMKIDHYCLNLDNLSKFDKFLQNLMHTAIKQYTFFIFLKQDVINGRWADQISKII